MDLFSTIDNKRIFEKPNGDQVVDLTYQTFNPSGKGTIYDYFVIGADLAMRPDLIGQLAYSDITAADLVMKTNGVSNPFAIDEYDFFFIQEKRAVSSQFSDGAKKEVREKVRSQYLDPSKAPEPDGGLQVFKNREKTKPKKSKKKDGPALPPNLANFGDQEIKLRGGKVIFGEDVTANGQVSNEQPLAKSEFLQKLARNRLLNKSKSLKKQTTGNQAATSLRDPGSIVSKDDLTAIQKPADIAKEVEKITKSTSRGLPDNFKED